MTRQQTELGAGSRDNIVVQIEGDQNHVQIGLHPKLLLTRFAAQRQIPTGKAHSELLQLSPYTLSTKLVGRDRELVDLDRFLHSDVSISVRVLTGDGGSGKTRLALHLCEHMAGQGWLAGFATSDAFRKFNAQPDRAEWGWSRPTLVVIDYASSLTETLRDWLDALADRLGQEPVLEHPLRILLLERHASPESGWLAELCASGGWASMGGRQQLFDPATPIVVPSLSDPADRADLLNQMLQRNGANLPSVSAEFVDQHLSAASWGGDPLFLMMAALHATQQGRTDALALRRTDLAQKLAEREGARLDQLAAAHQPAPLSKPLLRHLSACITLAQGLSRDAFLPLVSQESQATGRPTGGDPAEFHDLLAGALPTTGDGRLPPLLPDLIGEAFVLHTLKVQKVNATDLQRLYTPLGLPMIQTLVRCAQDFAREDADLPLPWLQMLARAASGDWQQLSQIGQAIPNGSVVLRPLNLEIAKLRGQALANLPDVSDELRAQHLSQASIAYAEMGQREEALEVAGEAVEIYRELARLRPDTFRPDLARSLNNVANRLRELGQREDTLEAARVAVEIFRELARLRPDVFRPDLAMSLNNVAGFLSELGQREEALEAAREAVEIRRELARLRPDAFRPYLAGSLNNVANFLGALGQQEEALEAAREAVEIRRELARLRPDAFLPDLAMSLNNVSNRLSELGQQQGALEAAREAVEIRRELARLRPDVFQPDLAMSLNNAANRLSALGQRDEALEAAREAVEIRRELARLRPDVFRPDLAMSLNNVANRLSEMGQREDALEAVREAVEIYRELARLRPHVFRPYLAGSLNNIAIRLSELGQREDVLEAAREAVEIYRELARLRPDAFRPYLAGSLNNVAGFMSELGQQEEALEAAREAVEIYRELVRLRPDAFRLDMAGSLNNVAGFLGELGQREGALEAAREAVEIYRELALLSPDAFRPDLARSLAVLGLRLQETSALRDECVSCFVEGIATLTPAFLRYPAGLSELMDQMVRCYVEMVQLAGIEPDMELLIPIQEVFQRLQSPPEHQGEST